ncbi:hypothetical protein IC582_030032 [Cucumis melo]
MLQFLCCLFLKYCYLNEFWTWIFWEPIQDKPWLLKWLLFENPWELVSVHFNERLCH